MQHLCGCPCFGEYTGAVELVPPEFLKRPDGRGICVDVCLALEVAELWRNGIVTTNSCCGHGRLSPTICVAPDSECHMIKLGYEYGHEQGCAPYFIAKTELETTEQK